MVVGANRSRSSQPGFDTPVEIEKHQSQQAGAIGTVIKRGVLRQDDGNPFGIKKEPRHGFCQNGASQRSLSQASTA